MVKKHEASDTEADDILGIWYSTAVDLEHKVCVPSLSWPQMATVTGLATHIRFPLQAQN